jgi:tRNA pseudouridine38-40 synthase
VKTGRPIAHYKSIIAYDGTEFHGFQRQAGERRSVQGELESALRKLGWAEDAILAAGRTDSGVHAQGQVIAYGLAWAHPVDALTNAFNALLPADISILGTQPCGADFHPRYAARRRRYRYTLLTVQRRDPLRERYAWRLWPPPDVQAMQAVADLMVGSHDFGAFGRAPKEGGQTRRQVWEALWTSMGDQHCFHITADAFLYRMVRHLVGAMVAVGIGRQSAEKVAGLLEDPQQRWHGLLAPPRGLCLEQVFYDG